MNITETTTKTIVTGLTVTLDEQEIDRIIQALAQRYGQFDSLRTSLMRAMGDTADLLALAVSDEWTPLRRALAEGKKIVAIKEVRAITDWGIKDSKDWVQEYIVKHDGHWDTIAKDKAKAQKASDYRLAELRAALTGTPQDAPLVGVDPYCCRDCDGY